MTTALQTKLDERLARTKPISFSQINTYAGCPLKWLLSQNYQPEFAPVALVFGSAFHSGVETYHRGQLEGRKVGLDEMMAAYDDTFSKEHLPIEYGKKDDAESLREKAEDMFAEFLANVCDATVLGVEQKFCVQLAEGLPPVLGYIDLILVGEDEDGPYIALIDYKTSARKPNEDDVSPEQLVLYAMAARRMGLLAEFDRPLRLVYRYLTKTKEPAIYEIPVEATSHEEARLVAKAKAVYRGMTERIIYPNPSWSCSTCQFRSHCALWPDMDAIEERFPPKGHSPHPRQQAAAASPAPSPALVS